MLLPSLAVLGLVNAGWDTAFIVDRYVQRVTAAVQAHGGHVISVAGDGIMSVDPAGSANPTINGVNDRGQLAGFFTDANDNVVGFVGTPVPEPSSIALLGAGLLGLG